MKNNNTKKLITTLLVFLLVTLFIAPALAAPAHAAASATVDVRFVVKNQQGPYKGVSIQFGKNTKTTGKDGSCEFRLKNIPVTTMVQTHLVDPNVPSGLPCDITLALGAHEDVKVNITPQVNCELSIMFTEYTKTIVIEYFVDNNYNYGYSNVTFEHNQVAAPQSTAAPVPQPPSNPQPKGDPAPPPPEEFHEDMMPEEFHEDMMPEEFHEDWGPENEHFEEPYREPFYRSIIPTYVWIIAAVGALLIITAIVIIVVLVQKNKKRLM